MTESAHLRSSPLGSRLWIRSGAIFVERCSAEGVSAGDLVVLLSPRSKLLIRVVLGTEPWRVADLLGREEDGPPAAVLARVERLKLAGMSVPVSRPVVTTLQRVLSGAYESSRARVWMQSARGWLLSDSTSGARRLWVGKPTVRLLTAEDWPELQRFAERWLSANPAFLRGQLEKRWSAGKGGAMGAFTRRGRMVGFAFFDEYRQEGVQLDGVWVRLLFTAPVARELGVARAIVSMLCASAARQGHAVLHADVRVNNAPSISLFRGLGFIEREDRREQLAPLHHLLGGAELLWFERPLSELP